jgi:hypothetical protein
LKKKREKLNRTIFLSVDFLTPTEFIAVSNIYFLALVLQKEIIIIK